jgi:regulatory protein
MVSGTQRRRGCITHPLFIFTGVVMITIVKTKRVDDVITVELDNGEALKIPYQAAGPYILEPGRAVEQTEYAQLKEESQRYRCKKMSLDYLAICPRSAAEMERYLWKKSFDHDLVREIVNGLKNAGYIDDVDYAARYISNKLGKKLVGKNFLSNELQKKGVPRSVIRQALKESEALHGNVEELYEMAMKKYASIKDRKNALSKLAYFLHSRGFESDMVNRVIDRIRREEKEPFDEE